MSMKYTVYMSFNPVVMYVSITLPLRSMPNSLRGIAIAIPA